MNLVPLGVDLRIGDDGAAGVVMDAAVVKERGCADGQVQLHIAANVHPSHGAAIDPARGLFQRAEDLQRALLRRSGDGATGEQRREDVAQTHMRPQRAVDRRFQVDERRMHRGFHQVQDANAAVFAQPPQVIALEIDDHDVLGPILCGGEQILDDQLVGNVEPARTRALDWLGPDAAPPFAHEQFGGEGNVRLPHAAHERRIALAARVQPHQEDALGAGDRLADEARGEVRLVDVPVAEVLLDGLDPAAVALEAHLAEGILLLQQRGHQAALDLVLRIGDGRLGPICVFPRHRPIAPTGIAARRFADQPPPVVHAGKTDAVKRHQQLVGRQLGMAREAMLVGGEVPAELVSRRDNGQRERRAHEVPPLGAAAGLGQRRKDLLDPAEWRHDAIGGIGDGPALGGFDRHPPAGHTQDQDRVGQIQRRMIPTRLVAAPQIGAARQAPQSREAEACSRGGLRAVHGVGDFRRGCLGHLTDPHGPRRRGLGRVKPSRWGLQARISPPPGGSPAEPPHPPCEPHQREDRHGDDAQDAVQPQRGGWLPFLRHRASAHRQMVQRGQDRRRQE